MLVSKPKSTEPTLLGSEWTKAQVAAKWLSFVPAAVLSNGVGRPYVHIDGSVHDINVLEFVQEPLRIALTHLPGPAESYITNNLASNVGMICLLAGVNEIRAGLHDSAGKRTIAERSLVLGAALCVPFAFDEFVFDEMKYNEKCEARATTAGTSHDACAYNPFDDHGADLKGDLLPGVGVVMAFALWSKRLSRKPGLR